MERQRQCRDALELTRRSAKSILPPMDSENDYYSSDSENDRPNKRARTNEEHKEEMKREKEELSIYAYKEKLIETIKANNVCVIVGETGSGKSTQLPQFIYEELLLKEEDVKDKGIVITQPRRVAAIALAKRVAEEMDLDVGKIVGYSVRFDDHSCNETRLKYMTDGVLVREALSDPQLSNYKYIMLDEAHERSTHTDILLGLLKDILTKRKDLHVIITSATLNTSKFSDFFDKCPIVEVPGRLFNVDIFHAKNKVTSSTRDKLWEEACEIVFKVHRKEPQGDILVFLPGSRDIDNAEKLLKEKSKDMYNPEFEMIVVPLYGALSSEKQQLVFKSTPRGYRKVVLATNIAETSLTVAGVRYVVDPGYVKQKVYRAESGIEVLEVVQISKTSAQQRAGRAGRTSDGKCFRLYPSITYEEMNDVTQPEILRSNLANTVLYLKCLGINDTLNFPFIDPPLKSSLIDSLSILHYLGALDDDGLITELGKQMSTFPVDPCLSKMLISSVPLECGEEAAMVTAMLSVENIFFSKGESNDKRWKEFFSIHGDHVSYINIFKAFKASGESKDWCMTNYFHFRALRMANNIYNQLLDIMKKGKIEIYKDRDQKSYANTREALCKGFFIKTAKKCVNNAYRTLADGKSPKLCYLHPTGSLNVQSHLPDYVMFHELTQTSKTFMRHATVIKYRWIEEPLSRIAKVDLNRLCGYVIDIKKEGGDRFSHEELVYHKKTEVVEDIKKVEENKKKVTDSVNAARERFLARKK